jgi:hypothetical protein
MATMAAHTPPRPSVFTHQERFTLRQLGAMVGSLDFQSGGDGSGLRSFAPISACSSGPGPIKSMRHSGQRSPVRMNGWYPREMGTRSTDGIPGLGLPRLCRENLVPQVLHRPFGGMRNCPSAGRSVSRRRSNRGPGEGLGGSSAMGRSFPRYAV